MREVLDSLKDKRRKDGYVIPLGPGKKERARLHMTYIIERIKEISGIKDFIFHNIRHTASNIMVSEALGRGVGLADVMKVLGHSQVETTMKYLHSDFGRMKKAVEALEEKSRERLTKNKNTANIP